MKINLSKIKPTRYYLVFLILAFVIYGNALNNEYSLDDNITVDKVDALVDKGFRAIPKIFKSRYATDKEQTYDYRPITTVSFAIEKQFFKKLPGYQVKEDKEKKDKLTQANISHFVNLILYLLTCIVLFQVLCNLFDEYNIILPLIITLIFLVHPLHTEVVVNIKSRDELLMFLFILLSIKQYFKYVEFKKIKYLLFTGVFILLSILSKKDGMAIVAILPVLAYFKGVNLKKVIYPIIAFAIALFIVKFLKNQIVASEEFRDLKFFENPLLYSNNFMDRITVGLYCSWFYLKMLIFPIDLSYYYGYNQIPMATWKYWEVWAAILFYVPLGVYGFMQFLKRKVIGLGIVLWLGLMLAVVNILFPIVGIVADRFTYMFSLGFCIVVGFFLLKAFKVNMTKENTIIELPSSFMSVMAVILIIYSGRTIARNPDWHDYLHLYETDVEHLENSAKAHALISNILYPRVAYQIKQNPQNPEIKKNIDKIIHHYHEAIRIDSTYITSLNNLGSAYIDLAKKPAKGLPYCIKALELRPNYHEATINIATAYARMNQPDSALKYFIKTIEIDPENLNVYNSINPFLNKFNMIDRGIIEMDKVASKSLKPKFIYTNLANLTSLDESKMQTTIAYFEKAFEYDKTDKKLCNHLVMLHTRFGDKEKVNYYAQFCN